MTRRRRLIAFLLALGTVLVVLGLYGSGHLAGLDAKFRDYLFRSWRGPRPAPADLVIVTMDEASLDRFGRWPWPRAVHAQFLTELTRQQPRLVVLDVLFLEPDAANPENDVALVAALRASGRVVLPLFFDVAGYSLRRDHWPLPDLRAAAVGTGFANLFPDADGVLRKIVLLLPYGEEIVPGLAVAAFAAYWEQDLQGIADVLRQVPTDEAGMMFLNYLGPPGVFASVSYADVAAGRLPHRLWAPFLERANAPDAVRRATAAQFATRAIGPADLGTWELPEPFAPWKERLRQFLTTYFQGKTVFVGGTASGLFDSKPTAFAPTVAGVEIEATVFENLLTHSYFTPVPRWSVFVALLLLGSVLGLALPRLHPVTGGVLAAALVAGSAFVSYLALVRFQLLVGAVAPAMTCAGTYVTVLVYRLVTEEREKRWIRSTFNHYLSPKVIDVLAQDHGKLRLGGEEREVTLFFADIADFTTMAEGMATSELVACLNEYLTLMTDVILDQGGLVDKYIGDAVMAFWNAPMTQADHALLACHAALECQDALREFRARLKAQGRPAIQVRIGLNTGPATVGNMGSTTRMNYTVIGDTVNLASRLEQANKTFGTRILISESTFRLVDDQVVARPVDRLLVKGKQKPVQVYELLTRAGVLAPALRQGLDAYEEALRLYYPERDFAGAAQRFTEVLALIPEDPVSRLYVNRCRQYLSVPPEPSWNGVFVMTHK